MTDSPRLLGGRYEVGELIGRGGMAEVHLGHDTRLGRSVAIKMLRADLARDQTFLARFRREAKSAAGLNHHAIVAVYDSGEETVTETGGAELAVPYMIMEYVDGETLRDILNAEGHLSPDEAARITQGILSALEYSHERGIVHRDIKPANVMLTKGGQVKVMDFGIARALADAGATMTSAQAVVGTARYLSPEQAKGDDVDARSDLYSAGCVLYELLSGRTPFVGEPVSLVYQHISDTPAPPSTYEQSVPSSMDAVTMHALEKSVDGRYQTAADFRADLQSARTDAPVSDGARRSLAAAGGGAAAARRSPEAAEPLRRDATREFDDRDTHRSYTALWIAATIAALLAIFGIGYLVFSNQGNDTKMVTVPQVVNFSQEAAEQQLTGKGFQVSVVNVTNDADKGTVIGQDPSGGTDARQGSVVTLRVSSGPGSAAVPDVRGKPEDEARKILTDAGFEVSVDSDRVDDTQYKAGEVAETSPAPNSTAKPGDTIRLKLSSGKVKVPSDLVGKDATEAFSTVTQANLAPKITYEQTEDSNQDGKVLRVSPDEGSLVALDSQVTLVVGRMAPATVTATATVTESPTSTPTSEPSSPTSSPSSSSPSSSSSTSSPRPSPTGTLTTPPPARDD